MVMTKETAHRFQTPDTDTSLQIAQRWLDSFAAAIALSEAGPVAALLTDDVYWRDILALSWDIRTISGKGDTSAVLLSSARERRPSKIILDTQSVKSLERAGLGTTIEGLFDF